MNIVFSKAAADKMRAKYTVLEVDSIRVKNSILECFCLLDAGDIPISELADLDRKVKMHDDLVSQFRAKNWDFCLEVIPHLVGSFKGALDPFYAGIADRIKQYKIEGISDDWHWAVIK